VRLLAKETGGLNRTGAVRVCSTGPMTSTRTPKDSTASRGPASSAWPPVYARLVLRIGAAAGAPGGLVTEVLESPAGQRGPVPFEPPFSPEDLAPMAAAMEGVARRHLRPAAEAPPPPSPDLAAIGRSLGGALFVGPVADALSRSLGAVRAAGGIGLRIELRIAQALPQAPALHAFPWEMLFAPGGRAPLSLDRRTPVVRYLELPRDGRPPPRPERLRILVVAPRPSGLPPLDLGREFDDLRTAWKPSDGVEVELLERPTLNALREALRRRPAHGLHFMGHGRLDPERGVGELLFEDDGGEPDPVAAELLAEQVEDFADHVRIVVLNACQSARPGALEPGLGVAQALVATGVPAVVAMQFPVSDQAALSFSRSLYRSLAEGDPVDAAVAEGRRAIRRDLRGRPEEAVTPALFLSVEDGRLFAPADPAPERRARTARSPVRRVAEGFAISVLAGLLVAFLASLPGGLWRKTEPAGPAEQQRPVQAGERDSEAGSATGPASGPSADGSAVLRSGMAPTTQPTAKPTTQPADAVPVAHTVAAGETVRLPEVAASVRVDFLVQDGVGFARVTVSPDDGAVVMRPAMGPKTFEVEAGGRTISIHVLGVDFERRTVELQATPPP